MGIFECGEVRVREVIEPKHFAIAPFQTTIFLGGDQDAAFATIARDGDGLTQRKVLITPDIALEIGGGDFKHNRKPSFRARLESYFFTYYVIAYVNCISCIAYMNCIILSR